LLLLTTLRYHIGHGISDSAVKVAVAPAHQGMFETRRSGTIQGHVTLKGAAVNRDLARAPTAQVARW